MKNIIIALTIFLVTLTGALALPAVMNEVEIDGTTLNENETNTLAIERGQDYQIKVRFTATADIDNAEVRTFISGYDYNDVNDLEDKTDIFDAKANVTYSKKLNINIPDDADEDTYKLRVVISDRNSDQLITNYNLKFDLPRNAVQVEDVIFNPSNAVKAGSALLTTVRIENKGEKEQNDVKVTVSIPALGLSATEYIDSLDNNDDEEETEEIFMRIPKCAKAGNYEVMIDVDYSQKHSRMSEKKTINVLADETCDDEKTPQTQIILQGNTQTITSGQTAIYPITLTNTGKTSKTFITTLQNADWATITITPTSTAVVPAGQTQTIFVNVQANENTPTGAHSLIATITSGNQKQEVTLTANVHNTATKGAFETILVVLVVILVVLGIVVGIAHIRGKDKPETYY